MSSKSLSNSTVTVPSLISSYSNLLVEVLDAVEQPWTQKQPLKSHDTMPAPAAWLRLRPHPDAMFPVKQESSTAVDCCRISLEPNPCQAPFESDADRKGYVRRMAIDFCGISMVVKLDSKTRNQHPSSRSRLYGTKSPPRVVILHTAQVPWNLPIPAECVVNRLGSHGCFPRVR